MGRKIKGKKHRTVKDPNQQRAKRLESLKTKIDNPPPKGCDQEIPKSLQRIIELKRRVKEGELKKKKRRKKKNLFDVKRALNNDLIQPGMKKPDHFIPLLVQKPTEKPEKFLKRISNMTQGVLKEMQFEDQFNVEIQRNPETGQVIGVKKLKKDDLTNNNSQNKSKKKSLRDKRKEKLQKLNAELKKDKDFTQFKDDVKFGEIVHRPPTNLPKLKMKDKAKELSQKPGQKTLLLADMLEGKDSSKVKKKFTTVEKEKAELERRFIVDAYRKSKKVRKI